MSKIVHGFEGKFSFLSNFYACRTNFKRTESIETEFPTSEHAYQAAKAVYMEDADRIAEADTPDQAKRRAHQITCREDWDQVKDEIMLQVVRSKFKNPEMRRRLMITAIEGYDGFCEDNYWHDNYWGNCTCEKCKDIPGQNKLGLILEKVRQEIIDGEED